MRLEPNTDGEALNPYASPQAMEPALTAELPVDVWAMRDRVIAHRQASWPRVCVLTGAEGVNQINLTVETHYPMWLFLAFIGCFGSSLALAAFLIPMPYTPIGVISALVANAVGVVAALAYFARPSQVRFYLCDAMFARRKRQLRMAMFVNGMGVLVMVGSLFLQFGWTGPIFFLGVIMLMIGGQLNRKWNTILKPVKMAREYTVFRGAGDNFLATLPAWPFGAV